MRSKPIKFAIVALALLFASGVAAMQWREHRLIRRSQPLQALLESYREQHRHYPASLSEAGVSEQLHGPIYYQRESDSTYRLWFGTQLGESKTFNSSTRRWQ